MIVMKFGGTSVNSAEKMRNIAHIVKQYEDKSPILVVSAIRGVTDMLLAADRGEEISWENIKHMHMEIASHIFKESMLPIEHRIDAYIHEIQNIMQQGQFGPARTDSMIAYGEIMSSFLISSALQQWDILSQQVLATKLIVTNNHFGSAEFIPHKTAVQTQEILLPLLKKRVVPVITGFIGATEEGKTTTLGRGGSDYSASIIASCLGVEEIQFWKDVDGVYTADPKSVKDAQLLEYLSYQEAANLLLIGAKILHPQTIFPVSAANIPIRVMNTMRPEYKGTLIHNREGNYL